MINYLFNQNRLSQNREKISLFLLDLHDNLNFFTAMQSLLAPLLSCAPKLDTDAKCCDIWPMLHLYLVFFS